MCLLTSYFGDLFPTAHCVGLQLCLAHPPLPLSQVDLSNRRNLYYLNPLDLLSASSIPFAKSICVESCPTRENECDVKNLPCTSGTQYM